MSSKESTFLISRILFTYKFVIPDTTTIQNKFFFVFWYFGQCSLDFNKLVIKVKMHAKTLFFWCMKNPIWFFSFETLGCTHKNIFSFNIFGSFFFYEKPGILIPDLYFYGIFNWNGPARPNIKKLKWVSIDPKDKMVQHRPKRL